jgi:hypothetical protein
VAARMTLITKSGWESMGTWLLAISVVVAPIRLATNRSMSGWTVRSFLPTMYRVMGLFFWGNSVLNAHFINETLANCRIMERLSW